MKVSGKLNLIAFWHLNLAFSSIEEDRRLHVIENCYRPLLRLANQQNLPFGIEITGYTLEVVEQLSPQFLRELKDTVIQGPCELIGSGFAQVIGPLVPPEVTNWNLRLGNDVYNKYFGFSPTTALINEQAFSAGIIPMYLDQGYKSVIMEWNNPASSHPNWPKQFGHTVRWAQGNDGRRIRVIWNNSISFQKLQHYAHGEISKSDYLSYLREQRTSQPRIFSFYGSDAEIFNHRPKRFEEEAEVFEDEWMRLSQLCDDISRDSDFKWTSISEALEELSGLESDVTLRLETSEQPIPVKKQGKYNIARWSVTGRADYFLNTRCWKIHDRICRLNNLSQSEISEIWKELVYLWSSDFRTFITYPRWEGLLQRLTRLENKLESLKPSDDKKLPPCNNNDGSNVKIKQQKHLVSLNNDYLMLELQPRRGLAIQKLTFNKFGKDWVLGTVPHGYFDDISVAEDFISGYFCFYSASHPNLTDLHPVKPSIFENEHSTTVSCLIDTPLGNVTKEITVYKNRASITTKYRFDWTELPVGTMRLGNFTFNPMFFDPDSIRFSVHNGGSDIEEFQINNSFDHAKPASYFVSSSNGVGLTGGSIQFGDRRGGISFDHKPSDNALFGMVNFQRVDRHPLLRFCYSVREVDETSRKTILMDIQKDPFWTVEYTINGPV
jgi:hypothetical protein